MIGAALNLVKIWGMSRVDNWTISDIVEWIRLIHIPSSAQENDFIQSYHASCEGEGSSRGEYRDTSCFW